MRVIADLTPADPARSWARTALIASIRSVALRAAAAWQALMALVAALSLDAAGGWLVGAEIVVGVVALAALRRGLPDEVVPLAMMATGLWAYVAATDIESTLMFAACWQINLASCIASLIILRRYLLPLVVSASATTAVALAAAHPEWGLHLAVSVVITQTLIVVVVRWGLPELLAVASDADAASRRAEEATSVAQVTRHLSAQLAEQSRRVHDTAINTLGAIANGGASVADRDRVRVQCARDVAELRAMRGDGVDEVRDDLLAIFDQARMPVRRVGMDDEQLRRVTRGMSQTTITAVVGCVREAVTNAAKHSGADSVAILVDGTHEHLRVVVSDDGVGFDLPGPAGRGLDISIRERALERGIEAVIDSVPGAGTRVALTVPLGQRDDGVQAFTRGELRSVIELVHRKAGMLWGLGVTAVGVALTITGGATAYNAHYPMLALMLASCALVASPLARRVPRTATVVLASTACVVFVLSVATAAFGTDGAVHLQALGATGPFVLMLSLRPGPVVTRIAFLAWGLLAATLCGFALARDFGSAPVIAVTAVVGLGFSVVWAAFQALVEGVSVDAWRNRQRAFEATLSAELARASQQTYRRWVDAGIDATVELLARIAEGTLDPADGRVAADCAAEERYLRQLIQVSPELTHLGSQLISTLRFARNRGVEFVLRLGDADVPDARAAHQVASVVFDSLTATSAGQRLTASVLPTAGGVQLTITGPALPEPTIESASVAHRTLGNLDVLQVTFAGSARPQAALAAA